MLIYFLVKAPMVRSLGNVQQQWFKELSFLKSEIGAFLLRILLRKKDSALFLPILGSKRSLSCSRKALNSNTAAELEEVRAVGF